MKNDLKKVALLGLMAGCACLSAQQEAPSDLADLELADDSEEVAMGRSEGGKLMGSGSPTNDNCPPPEREKASCRANSGCGTKTNCAPADEDQVPTCKKPRKCCK